MGGENSGCSRVATMGLAAVLQQFKGVPCKVMLEGLWPPAEATASIVL
jgi:hypothetical protein